MEEEASTDAPTEPPPDVPTFSLNYLSPVDNVTLVELACQESKLARATAFCLGQYTTTPEQGVQDGFEVNVKCEIAHGASSGPGCFTIVKTLRVLILRKSTPSICTQQAG